MESNNIESKLLVVFKRCSLLQNNENNIKKIEEFAEDIDSFSYMSMLLDVESEFNIEFPDECLKDNVLLSMDSLCEIIKTLRKLPV